MSLACPALDEDLSNVTPDELWAVWSRVPDFLLAAGLEKDPAFFNWVLASPGPQGLSEIQGPKGFPDDLLLALPLSRLQSIAEALEAPRHPSLPKWVQAALGRPEGFRLLQDSSGKTRLSVGENAVGPGKVLASGSLKAFFGLVETGKRILASRDWRAIHGDQRPAAQTGVVKWLDYQQNPTSAAALDRFLNEKFD